MIKRYFVLCCIFISAFIISGWASQAEAVPVISSITPETITRGEVITITGSNLSEEGAQTTVTIDGQELLYVEVEAGKKITVKVDTEPKPEQKKSAGEYERSLVVIVKGQASNGVVFHQLTWGVVYKARVFFPLLVYLVFVLSVVFGAKATVFKSKTGQMSLSKLQMGIWIFVFSFFYVLLAATWGGVLDVSKGMFWLMGISATTAAGAKAIVIMNIKDAVGIPEKPSKLFSDWNESTKRYELSLHRVQMAIWTLIVVTIFISEVIETMRLPEIPDNLLVLMGIGGGTYLGFNLPKSKQKG